MVMTSIKEELPLSGKSGKNRKHLSGKSRKIENICQVNQEK